MDLSATTQTTEDAGLEPVSRPVAKVVDRLSYGIEDREGTAALAAVETADPLWLWSEARIAADCMRLCPERTLSEALQVAGIVRYWGAAWRRWRPSDFCSRETDRLYSHVLAYGVALDREKA